MNRAGSRALACVHAAWLTLAGASALAADPSQEAYEFAIEGGTLQSVLDQVSRQAHLQVMTQLDAGERQADTLNAFVGRATVDQVLEAVLAGSGLSYTWYDASTIVIRASVVREPHEEGERYEVLVIGTRRLSPGEGAAPIRVYRREEIEWVGVSTVGDLAMRLRHSALISNSASEPQARAALQVLGGDDALVLINSRRVLRDSKSLTSKTIDLSQITMDSVERIEVLSDADAALEGEEARGGVVNIVLKNRSEDQDDDAVARSR